jgi:hypothetical protein
MSMGAGPGVLPSTNSFRHGQIYQSKWTGDIDVGTAAAFVQYIDVKRSNM